MTTRVTPLVMQKQQDIMGLQGGRQMIGFKIGHDSFRSQCLMFVFQTQRYVKSQSMEAVMLM